MPPKKPKGKKPPPPPPTPRRATVLVKYSYRGLNYTQMGLGGAYRRLRTLLLQEFCVGAELSVVGNGCHTIEADPLHARFRVIGSRPRRASRRGTRPSPEPPRP